MRRKLLALLVPALVLLQVLLRWLFVAMVVAILSLYLIIYQ
jgi:hypothetical protein